MQIFCLVHSIFCLSWSYVQAHKICFFSCAAVCGLFYLCIVGSFCCICYQLQMHQRSPKPWGKLLNCWCNMPLSKVWSKVIYQGYRIIGLDLPGGLNPPTSGSDGPTSGLNPPTSVFSVMYFVQKFWAPHFNGEIRVDCMYSRLFAPLPLGREFSPAEANTLFSEILDPPLLFGQIHSCEGSNCCHLCLKIWTAVCYPVYCVEPGTS